MDVIRDTISKAMHAHVEEVVVENNVRASTDKHLVTHRASKDLTARYAHVS